jgi:hypothetical protein
MRRLLMSEAAERTKETADLAGRARPPDVAARFEDVLGACIARDVGREASLFSSGPWRFALPLLARIGGWRFQPATAVRPAAVLIHETMEFRRR